MGNWEEVLKMFPYFQLKGARGGYKKDKNYRDKKKQNNVTVVENSTATNNLFLKCKWFFKKKINFLIFFCILHVLMKYINVYKYCNRVFNSLNTNSEYLCLDLSEIIFTVPFIVTFLCA